MSKCFKILVTLKIRFDPYQKYQSAFVQKKGLLFITYRYSLINAFCFNSTIMSKVKLKIARNRLK